MHLAHIILTQNFFQSDVKMMQARPPLYHRTHHYYKTKACFYLKTEFSFLLIKLPTDEMGLKENLGKHTQKQINALKKHSKKEIHK